MFRVIVPGPEEGLFQFLQFSVRVHAGRAGKGSAHPVFISVIAGVEEVEIIS